MWQTIAGNQRLGHARIAAYKVIGSWWLVSPKRWMPSTIFYVLHRNETGRTGGRGVNYGRKLRGRRARSRLLVATGALAAGLLMLEGVGVAQRASERRVANPGETQSDLQVLRPTGGPFQSSKGGMRIRTGPTSSRLVTST